MRFLRPLALLGLASCAAPLPCDHEQATATVERWVPKGTPLAAAQRTMTGHGFECAVERGVEHSSPAFANRRVDELVCRMHRGWLDDRWWQVHLVLEPGDRVESVDAWCSVATMWLP